MKQFMQESQHRFSIRKLTIGVVSVMFGTFFFGGHSVHAATTNKLSQSTELNVVGQESTNQLKDGFSNQLPEAGDSRFNEESQKNAPAILNQQAEVNSEDEVQNVDGVKTTTKIVATNKNTGIETSTKGNKSNNQTIINNKVADNLRLIITIDNTSNKDQNLQNNNYWFQLPAWNGTSAHFKVNNQVVKNGKIVFGGDYLEKGLSLYNYDLANGLQSSTGFSKSEEDASANPSNIGGFMIKGILKAGQNARIIIPLLFDPSIIQWPGAMEPIGRFSGLQNRIHQNDFLANIADEEGRHYFLIDLDKGRPNDYNYVYSVSQDIINDLTANNIFPTYKKGDAKVINNFGDNNSSNQTYLTKGAFYDLSTGVRRIDQVLNSYGYTINGFGVKSGNSIQEYAGQLKGTFHDANGKEIQLGTGNYSDFFIPIEKVLGLKKGESLVINQGSAAPDFSKMFEATNPQNSVTVTGKVDTSKVGVYPVHVLLNGTVNMYRDYKIIVVGYQEQNAYKNNDPKHQDLSASSMLTNESLKDLEDNGYKVEWKIAPDYNSAGVKDVQINIINASGESHLGDSKVNVLQEINVYFKNNGNIVGDPIHVYGTVGQTLGDHAEQITSSSIFKNLQKNYTISLQSVLTTKFKAETANQKVVIDLNTTPEEPNIPDQPIITPDNPNTPNIPKNPDHHDSKTNIDRNEKDESHKKSSSHSKPNIDQTVRPKNDDRNNIENRVSSNKKAVFNSTFLNSKKFKLSRRKATYLKKKNINSKEELPKTNVKKETYMAILGLAIVGTVSKLGLALLKKKAK